MTDETHLSPAQLARVEALRASQNVQRSTKGFAQADGPDAIDLVSVAKFILTGEDPWPIPEDTDD